MKRFGQPIGVTIKTAVTQELWLCPATLLNRAAIGGA